jgi:4-hydroxyphenylpyruvate dioxygenase-like putative hemolysin
MAATAEKITQFSNPMGTDGFEFVEYASTEPQKLAKLFEGLGFTAIAKQERNIVPAGRHQLHHQCRAEWAG